MNFYVGILGTQDWGAKGSEVFTPPQAPKNLRMEQQGRGYLFQN